MKTITFLSDFQHGTKNAKVYTLSNQRFGVICYDAQDDYNGFQSFMTEEDAENFAESWVFGNVTI